MSNSIKRKNNKPWNIHDHHACSNYYYYYFFVEKKEWYPNEFFLCLSHSLFNKFHIHYTYFMLFALYRIHLFFYFGCCCCLDQLQILLEKNAFYLIKRYENDDDDDDGPKKKRHENWKWYCPWLTQSGYSFHFILFFLIYFNHYYYYIIKKKSIQSLTLFLISITSIVIIYDTNTLITHTHTQIGIKRQTFFLLKFF